VAFNVAPSFLALKGPNKSAQGIALGFRGIALGFRGIAPGLRGIAPGFPGIAVGALNLTAHQFLVKKVLDATALCNKNALFGINKRLR
jgi:hypothetical protein